MDYEEFRRFFVGQNRNKFQIICLLEERDFRRLYTMLRNKSPEELPSYLKTLEIGYQIGLEDMTIASRVLNKVLRR